MGPDRSLSRESSIWSDGHINPEFIPQSRMSPEVLACQGLPMVMVGDVAGVRACVATQEGDRSVSSITQKPLPGAFLPPRVANVHFARPPPPPRS